MAAYQISLNVRLKRQSFKLNYLLKNIKVDVLSQAEKLCP